MPTEADITTQLAYLILGLGGGAVIAALAMGVVMTYRSSRVVNFAHAATGTYLAFAYFEFRDSGDLVLPLFAIPHRIALVPRPTTATALVLFAVLGALLGLLIHTLVFRPLRHAPALARVVASVGLFLYFWAVVGTEWAITPPVRAVLPDDNVVVLGRLVGVDRLALGGAVVVLAALLWLVGRHTRFGLVTTAAAENDRAARIMGINPERVAAINWMIATSLAGLAMICAAQIVALDPLNNSLLIVPALAAALVGGLRSFPITALAAVALGMVQSWLLNIQSEVRWLPDVGLQQGVPFLVILAVMALRGEGLPTRGRPLEGRFPAAPEPRHQYVFATALGIGALALLVFGASSWRSALITSTIFAVMALSVVVVTGFVGQISLAPYAFAGFAAFSMVRLADAGIPFPLSPLLAVLLAGVLGVVLGLPALKVRGLNLAILTLGAAVAIQELVFKWDWFTAGARTGVPEPELGPIDLSISAPGDGYPRVAFGVLCLVVLIACALVVANLRRSPTGLAWLAVRSNERAAAGTGVDVRMAKLSAFATSALLAGTGGCLLAYQRLTLSADSFGVFSSLSLVALTFLAGIGALSGSLVAGLLAPVGLFAIATGGDVGDPSEYQFAVSGLLLIAVTVLYPDGITGLVRAAWHRLSQGSTTHDQRGGVRVSQPE
ncbi:MAG: ABC transporter permease subunit [Microthrixaceae bacterium]